MKTTLYDLLELSPDASKTDIDAAHLRLMQHYQNGRHGLAADDAENRVRFVKDAWWTLSDARRRATYEASLLHAQSLAEAEAQAEAREEARAREEEEIGEPRWSLERIQTVIVMCMILAVMIGGFFFSPPQPGPRGDVVQTMTRPAADNSNHSPPQRKEISRAELIEQIDRRQQQREEDAAQDDESRQEITHKYEEQRRERALQERTRYANQVSAELQRAEAADRHKGEVKVRQAAEKERREAEEAHREAEEARRRILQNNQRWQQELRN